MTMLFTKKSKAATDGIRVALVGRRTAGCENLSLSYLKSALDEAGVSSFIIGLNVMDDISKAADQIARDGAMLVGLSIPDNNSAVLAMGVGQLLHKRGFQGHITCGGPFATLTRDWLLERHCWLDSVIRLAGETSLVALAQALEKGDSVLNVPGITTRRGDGPCSAVLRNAASPQWPHRDVLAERLGHNLASIIASRGCPGQCAYCGPAALQRMERDEARRLMIGKQEMDDCGIGSVKRRDMDDLCDEMHHLFKNKAVRHFAFTDEHLLPFEEEAALDYMDRLEHGLKMRGVTGITMGCQLHTAQVTQTVAERLAKMGFVRVLLGLDIGEGDGNDRFSRRLFGAREAGIIDTMTCLGIATVSNVMLVHPYSTVDTIAAGIDFMAEIGRGTVEALRMYVYEGTRLKDQLAAEGRLFGNPLRWEYHALDPAVQRFTSLFMSLKIRAFGDYSPGLRVHESMWDVSLARRFHPKRDISAQTRRLTTISKTIQETYVEAYRRALALSVDDASETETKALVDEFISRGLFISQSINDVENSLERALCINRNEPRTYKVFAASLFSFCLASSGLTGCYSSDKKGDEGVPTDTTLGAEENETHEQPEDTDIRETVETEDEESDSIAENITPTDESDPSDETSASDEDTPSDANHESDQTTDTGSEVGSETDNIEETEPVSDTGETTETVIEATDTLMATDTDNDDAGVDRCDEEAKRVVEAVTNNDPCFNGIVWLSNDNSTVRASVNVGHSIDISGPGTENMAESAQTVVDNMALSCGGLYASIDNGGLSTQSAELMDILQNNCDYDDRYTVVIDENGFVQDIVNSYGDDDQDAEVIQCLKDVLSGLSFPCLADTALSQVILLIL